MGLDAGVARAAGRGADAQNAAAPAFIFGATRSGTTVFRLMLDAHSDLVNPGEVDFLFDHLQEGQGGWRYDREALARDRVFRGHELRLEEGLDGLELLGDLLAQLSGPKGTVATLNVHRNLAKIRRLLPQARVIHVLRDPRDVAHSAIGMGWAGTLYHGANYWIEAETEWASAMTDLPEGQRLDVTYEALIGDCEGTLRRVCGFLGVPWREEILRYHVGTSYGPPDPRLIDQWKARGDTDALALLEGRIGEMMRARGYAPTGPGRRPGPVGRLALKLRNRLGVWRHAVRRHGLGLVLGEKLTRWLRLTGLHERYRERLQESHRRHLR